MDEQKKRFLDDAFLGFAVTFALQRCKTYREDAKREARDQFRAALKQRLAELSQKYTTDVNEEDHVRNIELLADNLGKEFAQVLEDGTFRVGSAQKALNLYLKYLWCAGQISMPPHCPFDSTIIRDLPGCSHIKWTTLDSIEDYRRLVESARAQAAGVPLAQWELEAYNGAGR